MRGFLCVAFLRCNGGCKAVFQIQHCAIPKLKSERHHWWPECVSSHWADEKGRVHWLLPSGEVRCSSPKELGVIRDGHTIKLGQRPEDETEWDENFESEFEIADNSFSDLITWLNSLSRDDTFISGPLSHRFSPVTTSDDEFKRLVTCMVSLAIRTPMNREAAVRLAEHFRGPLAGRERNALIGANMFRDQKGAIEILGTSGKFVVLFSPEREFVYGDGFFHNLRSPLQRPLSTKMLVPVTPRISVLFAQPMSYMTDPKFCTLVITADEAANLNQAVQVYSRNALFYRSEKPDVMDAYRSGKHFVYTDRNNPVDRLIQEIPGVPCFDKAPLRSSFASL